MKQILQYSDFLYARAGKIKLNIRGNGSRKSVSTETLDKKKKTQKLCADVGIQNKHFKS